MKYRHQKDHLQVHRTLHQSFPFYMNKFQPDDKYLKQHIEYSNVSSTKTRPDL